MLKSAAITVALLAGLNAPSALAATDGGPHEVSLVLLGTMGGPGAVPERSEPASLLIVDGHDYLIDAGAGVAHQLAAAGTRYDKLAANFLSAVALVTALAFWL